jgi:hypothetical protein
MAHKIITHRFRRSKRITQHVYAGPNAQLRKQRRRSWAYVLGLLVACIAIAKGWA